MSQIMQNLVECLCNSFMQMHGDIMLEGNTHCTFCCIHVHVVLRVNIYYDVLFIIIIWLVLCVMFIGCKLNLGRFHCDIRAQPNEIISLDNTVITFPLPMFLVDSHEYNNKLLCTYKNSIELNVDMKFIWSSLWCHHLYKQQAWQ